jgi:1-acyl-sn-glycerol-3-phosphate acyltransferase
MLAHRFRLVDDLKATFREHIFSPLRHNGRVERAAHHFWCALVRAYLGACHRLKVRGRQHIPARPPYVLAANHLSHLDALVLASALPGRLWDRVYPVAAEDTCFEPPVRAAFVACVVNALPIDRRRWGLHGLRELRQRLQAEACVYILFPEGTRSRTGRMGPFKGGLGMLVAGTDVPVVPCFLDGTFEALPPHRSWPRCGPITLCIGEPFTFPRLRNDRAGWEEVARATEAAVRRLRPGPAPAPRRERPSGRFGHSLWNGGAS